MIDLRAARNDPDAYRAALARKGGSAVGYFNELLRRDEAWRARAPEVDALPRKDQVQRRPTSGANEGIASRQGKTR